MARIFNVKYKCGHTVHRGLTLDTKTENYLDYCLNDVKCTFCRSEISDMLNTKHWKVVAKGEDPVRRSKCGNRSATRDRRDARAPGERDDA